MTTRPSTAAPILAALAVVAAFLGMYVGGYLFLVRQSLTKSTYPSGKLRIAVVYRAGGSVAEMLFWPANSIDRLVRPNHWRQP